MSRAWRIDAAVMTALVTVFGAAYIALGERIGVNGGQGWDGMAYTAWARDWWRTVVDEGLTRYHSQRVLPSAIVHYALRALDIKATVPHIITAFSVLNTVVLAASALLWASTAHALRLSRASVWLGFVALFVSHANLKHALYYPTLTDPTAFLLGMLLAWGYVTERPVAIWLASLAGVMTWPALPMVGIALLVFPRRTEALPDDERWPRVRRIVSAAAVIVPTVIFCVTAAKYLRRPVPGVGDEKFAAWVLRDWLPVSYALLAAFLVGGWYVLAADRRLWRIDAYLRRLPLRRTIIATVGIAVLVAARAWWIQTIGRKGAGPSTEQFICEHTLAAIRGPLWGPVHHVVYVGPIIVVAAVAWRRIAALANTWGPVCVLALALAIAFAAGSQSRQWLHLVPLLVTVTVAATDEMWTRGRVVAFAAVALAWSKVWLTIGYDTHEHWHQFPNQRFFMHYGPYASDTMYVVHLIGVALTSLFVVWLYTRRR